MILQVRALSRTNYAYSCIRMSLPDERRRLILEAIESDGKVLATELAIRFHTSEDTIRRDLRDLDLTGALRRVHGGAVRRSAQTPHFQDREHAGTRRKALLGHELRNLFHQMDVVLIDAGSTNLALARLLEDGCAASIVTNSPHIAMALGEFKHTQVVLLGGNFFGALGAVLGARALSELVDVRADLCIVGACSIDAEHGVAASNSEEAVFKRMMFSQSARRACAVLNERLNVSAAFRVAKLGELDHLILENDAPRDVVGQLRQVEDCPDIIFAGNIGE
jgi:DeoR/GlpR family transcriptional regulator of sugar metabolism